MREDESSFNSFVSITFQRVIFRMGFLRRYCCFNRPNPQNRNTVMPRHVPDCLYGILPINSKSQAMIALFLNIFLPGTFPPSSPSSHLPMLVQGVGTMFASFAHEDPTGAVAWGNLFVGILQLLTSVLLVGWIWALVWSYWLIQSAIQVN